MEDRVVRVIQVFLESVDFFSGVVCKSLVRSHVKRDSVFGRFPIQGKRRFVPPTRCIFGRVCVDRFLENFERSFGFVVRLHCEFIFADIVFRFGRSVFRIPVLEDSRFFVSVFRSARRFYLILVFAARCRFNVR